MTSTSRRRLLKRSCATIATAGLLLTGSLVAPVSAVAADISPYDAVNMWIGTANDPAQNKANIAFGNTWPGAALPFGMVQFSPTTTSYTDDNWRNENAATDGAYMTSDSDIFIRGFGMTRLSGTGCNDRFSGFDLPFLPYTGTVNDDGTLTSSPGTSDKDFRDNFASRFSHDDEEGAPGYYKVALDTDGGASATDNSGAKDTTVELTATTRTGIAKIAFPEGKDSAVLFNVSGANNYNGLSEVTVDAANRTISGFATAKTVCNEGSYRIFFSTQFDQPFEAVSTWQDSATSTVDTAASTTIESAIKNTTTDSKQGRNDFGVVLKFADGQDVEMRTGISYVSADNAALNRTTEAPAATNFDTLHAQAKTTWENTLNSLDVTGGSTQERTKFYSALYHSLLHPNVYEDVNGQYRGYYSSSKSRNDWPTSGDTIKQLAEGQEHEYVTYSSWDSLRGQMQLIAMLFPKVGSDMAASIVNMGQQVGTWYNWPHLGSAQKKMEGDGMQVIVASLYAFGSREFDAAGAVDSMVNATSLGKDSYFRANFVQYAGTGFIEDRWTTATSTTMDYAMADFAIAQLAQRVGKDEVYDQYMTRAQSWRNLVNQVSGTNENRIVPRDRKGHWGSFDLNRRSNSSGAPDSGAQNRDQYDQSTGNQYQWYMTQNMAGVIDALGGDEAAETYLDSLFNYPTLDRIDVSGSSSNGMYMSNQPSMHTPWVYSWLGKPSKATDVLDKARATMYCAEAVDAACKNPGFSGSIGVGLPGNDDLGSLSSWFVWSSIGLYPAIFGRAELLVTSPAFDKVTITSKNLDGTATGRTITVNAPGQADGRYIQSSTVNGTASTKSYLPESFTQEGGTLDLVMGATASDWGTGSDDVPPSFDDQRNAFNGVGTGQTGTKNAGSLDVGGITLPREKLAESSNGATPGAELTYDGLTYVWPNSAPLTPDHWVPNGQEITIGKHASKIGFLGVATNGPATGSATVVYTDGTTTSAQITLPDWTGGGATDNARLTGSGRLKSDGTLDSSTWRIYTSQITNLDSTKRIDKVILPTDVSTGLMHIFSIGTDADTTAQHELNLESAAVTGGQPITISGTEFKAGDVVSLSIDTDPVTTQTVTVGESGEFSLGITLGAVAAGTYNVTATVTPVSGSPTSYDLGSVSLTYSPEITSGNRAPVSGSYEFAGSGFAPGELVTVEFAGQNVTVTAAQDGTITGTITAPATIGAYDLTATGAVSQVEAVRSVAVVHEGSGNGGGNDGDGDGTAITPVVKATASATSTRYGDLVTLRATVSDSASGTVVFLAGDKLVGQATVARGSASVRVKLPAGKHSIVAVYLGSATHAAAESSSLTISVAKVKVKKVTVKAKKYSRAKAAKVTVKIGKLPDGSRAAGTVTVKVGKKKVRTVSVSAAKKRVKVKVAKKFTSKKKIKVRAIFKPTDRANIDITKSKVKVVKAR